MPSRSRPPQPPSSGARVRARRLPQARRSRAGRRLGRAGRQRDHGRLRPGDTAEVAPTTSTTTGAEEPTSTATSENSTTGQDPSDSTTAADASTGEPDFGHCPYAPDGVDVTLTRVEQGLATDLSARDCGTVEQLSGLQVIAAGVDHLAVSACADASCGACDPAVTLDLALALPDGLVGLPAQLAAGDCLQLDVEWSRPGADPAQCEVGGLAVVGLRRGHPEPVPKFMYRFTGAVPHTDPVGPFALTGLPTARARSPAPAPATAAPSRRARAGSASSPRCGTPRSRARPSIPAPRSRCSCSARPRVTTSTATSPSRGPTCPASAAPSRATSGS
ncbi:hypothetical protein [Nannocystis pusilla]|uniref:hypothetical protein n=1 Tax=Nannocystis pusilla TaxID=889268 RepID=UPI003B78375A